MDLALGIDIGTGSTKVGLVDGDGRLRSVGRSAHPRAEPRPGWSEIDPQAWLVAAGRAAAEAVAGLDDPSGRVVAVGLSGQMHGVVVCGPDRVPLRPAILWSDRRSEPDLAGVVERLDAADRARLANPIVAGMAGTTLAALRRLEPELVDRIGLALQPKDWVRAELTGEVATDPSDASATLLWDVAADDWSPAALEVLGVERSWLAPVIDSAGSGGALTAEGASLLGLPVGTPVAVGAADTAAALLGAGVESGETQLSTGTGGQLARSIDEPQADPTGRTQLYRSAAAPGAATGRWYAMAAIQNAGVAIDWALGLLGAGPDEVEAAVGGRAGRAGGPAIEPDHVTFLPYLTGERTPHLDPSLTGRWVGLRPGTTRAALIRSVFQGVAFALADGLDALRAAGHPVEEALLAGGGSVAPWWRQLLADALQVSLVPHDAVDASVRGAALLAWASVGVAVPPGRAVRRLEPIVPSEAGIAALAPARARFRACGPGAAGYESSGSPRAARIERR